MFDAYKGELLCRTQPGFNQCCKYLFHIKNLFVVLSDVILISLGILKLATFYFVGDKNITGMQSLVLKGCQYTLFVGTYFKLLFEIN